MPDMHPALVPVLVFASLALAIFAGFRLRRAVPEHHRSADTKDTIKLAMGLVATMSALLLGLLVASAKSTYDNSRSEVATMSAKFSFLGRVLDAYGPEAADAESLLRHVLVETIEGIWNKAAPRRPNWTTGNQLYLAIQHLQPTTDVQRSLKTQALTLAMELGQLRALLGAQAIPSVAGQLLAVVVFWLFIIFFAFSFLAPTNASATVALVFSAMSVSAAMFLVLELDQPFAGFLRLSKEPMQNAIEMTSENQGSEGSSS